MCGIAGVVHRDPSRPVARDTIRTMCAALRHRGPDDEGLFVAGRVGLGMRRLSIIDVAGSHQPIFNEDESKVIVFNGEIYNYRALRAQLVARGHRFRTQGDTETVLHLYEERGPECVRALRGMFAFAIWDATAGTLLLARDRFGIKPLYVATGPWGIAFASELKALLAAGLSARELDWEGLDAYFQLGYVPAPATPFKDVRKLEAAHTLRWRNGAATVTPYWDLPHGVTGPPPNVEREVIHWLDESVAAHLVSDVPVAAFLSGGLDSSAVVAGMAMVGAADPHAFTAHYAGSGAAAADESTLARWLAERYDARHTLVEVRPDVQGVFEPIVRALDEPHADDSAIPTWALSQAVGGTYKVALTGIGGDELFAGYRRHIGYLAGEQYARLPGPLRRGAAWLAGWLREPADAGLGVNRLKRFLRLSGPGAGAGSAAARFLELVSLSADAARARLYAPELRARMSGDAARRRFRHLAEPPAGLGPPPRGGLATALYLDYRTFLSDDILALSDRLSMAHSLEIRVPLVDHELVERVFPLPDRVKIGWWRTKALMKRALRHRLLPEQFRAPKRGFVGPTGAWLRHELRGMLLDELSAARLRRLGYFDPSAVGTLLKEHFARRQNHERMLYALLCFSTWHRLFVEAPAAPAVTERHAPARPAERAERYA